MFRAILLIVVLLTGTGPWTLSPAAPLLGEVVHVADGDSLTIRVAGKRMKVALAGIDAPELDQPHGARARKALGDLVFGRTVRVEPRPIAANRDAIRRRGQPRLDRPVVARVLLEGMDAGAEMVRRGHAWAVPGDGRDAGLSALEAAARAAREGLWAADGPIAPWEWRLRRGAPAPPEPVFCTQDVKQCPDGSWVSRQPPGCGFAPCPGPVDRRR